MVREAPLETPPSLVITARAAVVPGQTWISPWRPQGEGTVKVMALLLHRSTWKVAQLLASPQPMPLSARKTTLRPWCLPKPDPCTVTSCPTDAVTGDTDVTVGAGPGNLVVGLADDKLAVSTPALSYRLNQIGLTEPASRCIQARPQSVRSLGVAA